MARPSLQQDVKVRTETQDTDDVWFGKQSISDAKEVGLKARSKKKNQLKTNKKGFFLL